ncbi:MAG: hypothetical protein AAFY26_18750, partial [Cyanobacteria bacterium J06638_22]
MKTELRKSAAGQSRFALYDKDRSKILQSNNAFYEETMQEGDRPSKHRFPLLRITCRIVKFLICLYH